MKFPAAQKSLAIFLAALAALVLIDSAKAVTVTNYTTGNFNTNSGWTRGYSIITTNQGAQAWQGNDPYNPGNNLGEVDNIAYVAGYTPGGSLSGNSSWINGGYYAPDFFPGTNNVRAWKTFTPSTGLLTPTVTFNAEWSLVASLDPSFTNADRFVFDLRNAANTVSLLSLVMTQGINIASNAYTLQTVTGTNAPVTRIDLGYQGLYRIGVAMTGSTYDLNLSLINPTNSSVVTNYSLVTGAALNGGYTASDFATILTSWELASGNNLQPGSNYMIANNFAVTTTGAPIPEAGTWAVGSLLLGGVLLRISRRRRSGCCAS